MYSSSPERPVRWQRQHRQLGARGVPAVQARRRGAGVAPDGELVEQPARAFRDLRRLPGRVGPDDLVHRGAVAEPAQRPRVQRAHAGQVERDPPGRQPAGLLGIGRDGDGQAGRDPRPEATGRGRARVEQLDARGQAGDRQQEREPAVGQLTGDPGRGRPQRGQVDPQPGARIGAQPQRPVLPGRRRQQPVPGQQPPHLPGRRGQPPDRVLERRVVQALGQLRAARAQPQLEPAAGDLVQGAGQHGQAGRAAAPDVEHAGADPDPVGPGGHLGEQHRGVVPPALGEVERVVAELLGAPGQRQHHGAAGLHRGQRDGERAGHGVLLLTSTVVMSGMSGRQLGASKPCARSRSPSSPAENETASPR